MKYDFSFYGEENDENKVRFLFVKKKFTYKIDIKRIKEEIVVDK